MERGGPGKEGTKERCGPGKEGMKERGGRGKDGIMERWTWQGVCIPGCKPNVLNRPASSHSEWLQDKTRSPPPRLALSSSFLPFVHIGRTFCFSTTTYSCFQHVLLSLWVTPRSSHASPDNSRNH